MIFLLSKEDVSQAAKLHYSELDGLLSNLGLKFLEKYYLSSLNIPEMWTIVEKNNDHIYGFVSGITSVGGLNKKIINTDLLGYIILFLSIFITRPGLLIKTIKILSYPGFSSEGPELLTMVVGKKHQKKGIGKKLFQKCAEEFNNRKIKSFKISTYDKLTANEFYKHIGCRFESNFMFLGEKMNYYRYEIK